MVQVELWKEGEVRKSVVVVIIDCVVHGFGYQRYSLWVWTFDVADFIHISLMCLINSHVLDRDY